MGIGEMGQKVSFLKVLVSSEPIDDILAFEEADIIVTPDGRVSKNRYGKTTPEHMVDKHLPQSSNPPRMPTHILGPPEQTTTVTGGGCTFAMSEGGDCEHAIGLPGKSIPGQHDGPDNTVDEYGKPNGWCWSCWKSHQIDELRKLVQALQAWQDVAAESNRNVSAYLKEEFPSLDLDGGMPVGNVRKVVDYLTLLIESKLVEETLSASEALYGFCGWLTTQNAVTKMSRSHDAGCIATLIDTFCKKNNLPEPRGHWEKQLEHPSPLANTPRPDKVGWNSPEVKQLKQWAGVALKKLSGDLSNDNVAGAKQILKRLVD